MSEHRVFAIIPAAGSGTRLGVGEPKAFLDLGGRSMLELAAATVAECHAIHALIAAVPAGSQERARALLADIGKPVEVVTGGRTRQDSVSTALEAVPEDVELVVVHDAARPFAPEWLFTSVIEAVTSGSDGAIPVLEVTDTLKRVRDGVIVATEPRDDLALAQTPQCFRASILRDAHERAAALRLDFTDDAALVEWGGHVVRTVPGDAGNVKITTPADLERAIVSMGGRVG